jgi:hypothetical protein
MYFVSTFTSGWSCVGLAGSNRVHHLQQFTPTILNTSPDPVRNAVVAFIMKHP